MSGFLACALTSQNKDAVASASEGSSSVSFATNSPSREVAYSLVFLASSENFFGEKSTPTLFSVAHHLAFLDSLTHYNEQKKR